MTEDDALACQARLARNFTHALGNMLTVIAGNLDLTAGDIENGRPPDNTLIKRAQAATRRAGDLLAGLRAFYGTATICRDIDLPSWWAGLEHDLAGRVSRWSGPPPGTRAWLDPDDLARAVHAVAALRGAAGVISGELSVDGESSLRLRLQVQGIGHGRDPECAAGEPFAFGEASPLGLSAAWGAARRANGSMTAESDTTGGLTVRLDLPRRTEPGEQQR